VSERENKRIVEHAVIPIEYKKRTYRPTHNLAWSFGLCSMLKAIIPTILDGLDLFLDVKTSV